MLDALADDLIALFGRGVDAPLPDEEFDRWARRVFEHQFGANDVYRAFCRGRGVVPDRLAGWREIPAVPTRAFKRLPLLSAEDGRVEALFRTSGTTRGPETRGEHRVPRLDLYRASLLPNFRTHLLPDGARLPVVSLIPSPERSPDSSLSHMAGVVVDEAADGGGWYVDPEEGIREEALWRALAGAEADGRPVLVLATAFALVHALDPLERAGRRFRLPDGSRIMETGGFKGRSRTLEREAFYGALEERLGVPTRRIVNEYGMTELLSQFYEPVMREAQEAAGGGTGESARPGVTRAPGGAAGARPAGVPDGNAGAREGPSARRVRHHRPPPWVRTRVVDPETLEPLQPGEPGLLCHLDLANAGSVAAVLTEDLGVRVAEGFRVLGRAGGAEPRGCSLAMDELLRAAP